MPGENMAYVKGQPFVPQFTDPATGLLMASGTVEFYLTGTSTPTAYYTDSAGTSGGTSLTLDSGGKPSTDIYFDTSITYKIVVKDAAGSTIDTIDPFSVGIDYAQIPNNTATIATVAAIQAANLTGVNAVQTLGYTTAGDGGGALYRADTGDTSTADDGYLCIVSNDGVRLKLCHDGVFIPRQAGATADGSTDDYAALNAIITAAETEYALGNRNIIIDFQDAYYAVSQSITFTGLKYAELRGTARFISTHSNDFILKFDTCNYLDITGHLFVQGGGGTTFSTRTNLTGVLFENSSHTTGNKLEVWYTVADGIRITGSTSQPDFRSIQTAYCGSGVSGATSEATSTFTSQTQNGSANNAAQRSVITCNTVPQTLKDYLDASIDTSTDKAAYLVINDRAHFIESYSGSTVTVWPWVDTATTNGTTIYWVFGAGIFAAGSDTSVATIAHHDALVCGLGYVAYSLYPATIGALVSQNNGIALLNGKPTSGAALGMTIQCGYFESNTFDYVQATQADASFSMLQTIAFSISKCERMYSANSSGTRQNEDLSDVSIVLDDGYTYISERKSQSSSSSVNCDMWKPNDLYVTNNTVTIQINEDSDYATLFKRSAKVVYWYGNTNGMTPSGSITFTPPSGGTINGGAVDATQVFNTASGPQVFIVSRSAANTYFIESLAPSTVTKV